MWGLRNLKNVLFSVRWCAHRWMGSMRFTLGAIHEVLRHRRYAATVAYMPAAKSTQDSAKMVSKSFCQPPGMVCVSGCSSV